MDSLDFVPYETAKKLKAAGFDEPCDHYYTSNKAMRVVKGNALAPETTNNRFLEEISDECCTAVPLWQAQKWLREKKEINVLIGDCACGYYWEASKAGDEQTRGTMLIYYDGNGEDECSGMWLSYEAALSAGIDAALELILCLSSEKAQQIKELKQK